MDRIEAQANLRRWACVIVVAGVASVPATGSARQLGEEEEVWLVAFHHMASQLFPADTAAQRTYCIAIRDEADFTAPPDFRGRDPSPALLRQIRRITSGIVPASMCPYVAEPTRQDTSVLPPIVYSLGRPTQIGSNLRVPVSYQTDALRGGGWACTLGFDGGEWRIVECLPSWIS
jgi:hypothetical protein